jgi:hypothetical protein
MQQCRDGGVVVVVVVVVVVGYRHNPVDLGPLQRRWESFPTLLLSIAPIVVNTTRCE